MTRTRRFLRSSVVLVLFAGLAVLLLWFQGLILRPRHALAEAGEPPRLPQGARTATVEARELPAVESYPGFVEAVDPAELAPRVMARVLDVARREGEAFEKDEVLVTLDDADARARLATAEAEVAAAGAAAERDRLEHARIEKLAAAKAATARALEAARAAREASEARLRRARAAVAEARTALAWYRLRAPFAGRVLERCVDPGNLATPGRPVLRLDRGEALRVTVAVPETRARALRTGAELPVWIGDRRHDARLVRVLPDADPATGTVRLHLRLPAGTAAVRPGTYARLDLPVGKRAVLLVPTDAVDRLGQIERVRLVRADGRVVLQTVRTGKRHGDLVEILSGLRAGEKVVRP